LRGFCLLVVLPLFGGRVDAQTLERQQVIETTMRPYDGPSEPGIASDTLDGKVMCGYQGWFSAPEDGSERGWRHWGPGRCQPGACTVSLWPDASDLTAGELFDTGFRLADGTPARVFSSYNRATVLRHFEWMRDYGIDGVFVQRFAVETIAPVDLRQRNVVLAHCREGANRAGRTYAVMYDLSGLGAGQIDRVIDDWKELAGRMKITADPAYQHHAGKPVVAVWGLGLNDGRRYTLDEGRRLVQFLQTDPDFGGCTVMLGVPTYWRTLDRDALSDPALLELIARADIVSPWTVGRYATLEQAARHADERLSPDLAWCRDRDIEYMPVVFPGFQWFNSHPDAAKSKPIPRQHGRFLWEQVMGARRAGASMLYVAMFDEVDEGTAIFKCTNDPPGTEFATFEGDPPDHYLRLVGRAGRMLRGEAVEGP
jgi:hypothetical protein